MEFQILLDEFYNQPLNIKRYIPDKFAKYAMIDAIPHLTKAMQNNEEHDIVRIECAEALGKLGHDKGISALILALDNTLLELRRTSLWSLGQIGTEKTLDPIFKACYDTHPVIRKWSIKSLRRVRSPRIASTYQQIFNELRLFNQDLEFGIELFRSVADQIENIDNSVQWFEYAIKIMHHHSDGKFAQALWYLFDCEPGIAFLFENYSKNLLNDLFQKLHYRRPEFKYLLNILAILGYQDLIITKINKEIKTGDTAGVKLMLRSLNDYKFHIFINEKTDNLYIEDTLYSINKFPEIIPLKSFLEKYPNYDPPKNLQISIHASQGGDFLKINEALNSTKIMKGMVNGLVHYGEKGVELLSKFAIDGNKSQRIEALGVLKVFRQEFPKNKLITEVLAQIMNRDRIWHIRRDARIALEK